MVAAWKQESATTVATKESAGLTFLVIQGHPPELSLTLGDHLALTAAQSTSASNVSHSCCAGSRVWRGKDEAEGRRRASLEELAQPGFTADRRAMI